MPASVSGLGCQRPVWCLVLDGYCLTAQGDARGNGHIHFYIHPGTQGADGGTSSLSLGQGLRLLGLTTLPVSDPKNDPQGESRPRRTGTRRIF